VDKMFNLTSTFKSEAHEDGSVMVRGMASTVDFDRAGDSIVADAWTKGGLGNFEKNPVILFNHDHNKPIGRATKVTPTGDGLHMEAKISKHAECADLIKDGVLGAFSVGFRVKDADYVKETDGLMIKDAELFEVSVVSVPCNQAATFSLAKSFDSEQDYEDFKKTFKSEEDSSSQEIDMSEATQTPEIDLEAFAKKVAEETATKIAMKAAETKAAEKAEAEKAAEAEAAKQAQALDVQGKIRTGIETGAEKLVEDIQKEFADKQKIDMDEIVQKYEKALKDKEQELEDMKTSKRTFAERTGTIDDLNKQELVHAQIVGKLTGKGWNTAYAKDLLEKASVSVGSESLTVGLDLIVSTSFEETVKLEQKIAPLFRELPVQTAQTQIPTVPDTAFATFDDAGIKAASGGDTTANMLTADGSSAGTFATGTKTVGAYRLISGTYIDNNTEEQVLVTLAPMITASLARAHAKAVDKGILMGVNSKFNGLIGGDGTELGTGLLGARQGSAGTTALADFNSAFLLTLRKGMGKYGLNPSDVKFVVPTSVYYGLLGDAAFADVSDVGSDAALKLTGVAGAVYGTPVIVTDILAGTTGGTKVGALCVYTGNFLVPRLRGINIETEYSVAEQRTALVASQALGFNEIFDNTATDIACIYRAISA
tara:strand:- start:753 stop:2714 length:1962 start_codon:yes stop_codon:yes gene_type:complete